MHNISQRLGFRVWGNTINTMNSSENFCVQIRNVLFVLCSNVLRVSMVADEDDDGAKAERDHGMRNGLID